MDNKIKKSNIDCGGDYRFGQVRDKFDEVIGMLNEHTDKINEIIQSLSTLPKAKEHNNDFKKVCPIITNLVKSKRMSSLDNHSFWGKPIQKS